MMWAKLLQITPSFHVNITSNIKKNVLTHIFFSNQNVSNVISNSVSQPHAYKKY